MKFEIEAGIYKLVDNATLTFDKEVVFTDTFEASMGTYPKYGQSEIPYQLLNHAKEIADDMLTKRKDTDCRWWSEYRNWITGYWCDEPHWRDTDVTEVYQYWHEGFEKCLYLKLSWDMDTLERADLSF